MANPITQLFQRDLIKIDLILSSVLVFPPSFRFRLLTWPDVLPQDANPVIPVVGGLHVEEADDVEPLVDDDGVVEATASGGVASQVQGVDAPCVPETNAGVAAVGSTLGIDGGKWVRAK